MTSGMDTENISDARKTAIINNELLRLKVDIAAFKSKLKKKRLNFFLSHFLKLFRTFCLKISYSFSKKNLTRFTVEVYSMYQKLLRCIYHLKKCH